MENIQENSFGKRTLVAVVLVLATILAVVVGQAVMGSKAYGLSSSSGVNVSVQVESGGFIGPPSIDDIGPLSGPDSGGTMVTITGDNLDGVVEVSLGDGYKCEPITHVDNKTLTCTMPEHAAGYVDVTLKTAGYGEATKNNGFRYLSNAIPPNQPDGDNGAGPLVPNTGLFRLGEHIITLYDVLAWAIAASLLGLSVMFVIWKRFNRDENSKTT
jgi:hypothetical protein